jgi:hypothetical protein
MSAEMRFFDQDVRARQTSPQMSRSYYTYNLPDASPSPVLWRNTAETTEVWVSPLVRIRQRRAGTLRQAEKLRQVIGDPVDKLTELLDAIPIVDEDWERLITEP